MITSRPPLLLIAGPTASGKSALALAAAERIGGVLVNADSAQVYRDLKVLSARPSSADLAYAEHRLYGTQDASAALSAAAWAAAARREICEVHARGRTPILVGGTGLYLRTLLDGIAPVPPIDPAIRLAIRSATVADNYEALRGSDPTAAARLSPADTTRVARALEVVRSTGRTLAGWQTARNGGLGSEVALKPLILLPPRDWLVERCDRRFAAMLAAGAIDEVRLLLERRLDPQLPAMRAIGVREIASFLAGHFDRDTMIERGRIATRQYAKRQYTWFTRQPPSAWARFDEPIDDPAAERRALALLGVAA